MWKTVSLFSNYEINNLGNVRNKKTKKILSQSLSSKGYYQINIDGKSRRAHRLLAETFIANPDNLETVNHKDGNKLNNNLNNLEWMSRGDNIKHSREVLNLTPIPYSISKKAHHFIGKKGFMSNSGKKIKAILHDKSEIIFGSAYEAGESLFNDRELGKSIRQSINRKSSFYRGIKFKNYE